MSETCYAVHGLVVRAPFRLRALPVDGRTVDVRIVEGLVPVRPPDSAELVLRFEHDSGQWVEAWSAAGRIWVTFGGVARFCIHGGTVTFEVLGDRGLVEILCEGWIMAMVVFLAGHAVLHASAVVNEHGTFLFVGNSGSGKSTLAGLLCREGSLLVTDDVARVDFDNGTAKVRRGSTALRLRTPAFAVADGVPGDRARTVDDRLAFAPEPSGQDEHELDAVLIPLPDRSAHDVTVTWLEPGQAAWELLQRPRIYRFVDTEARGRELADAARVAEHCRVGFLRLPWGPPWPTELSTRIAEATSHKGASR